MPLRQPSPNTLQVFKGTMSFLLFPGLAVELQQAVLQQCEITELLNLALCSRDMNQLATPIIYRHVDISDHNEEGLFTDFGNERMVRADNLERTRGAESGVLFYRQNLFIDTITRGPSYGAYVYSLTWTYTWIDESSEADQQRLWKMFQNLKNLVSLDICSMDREQQYVVPPPLFPSATKIRIGGRMTYAFFRAILSHPTGIRSLEIDNVQGLGQVSDGVPLYDADSLFDVRETKNEDLIPMTRHSGPMRGHLVPFTGKFTSLRSLCIRSIGQDDYPDSRFSDAREKERYGEVAKFLESLQPNLERLTLEYGTEADKPFRMPCRGTEGWVEHLGRPMDGRFLKYVLPTLSRGPWPALKALTIIGVGGKPTQTALNRCYTPEDRNVFDSAEASLRKALRSDITFQWETENNRSFYLMEPEGDAYRL